jgi:hypothetical protein
MGTKVREAPLSDLTRGCISRSDRRCSLFVQADDPPYHDILHQFKVCQQTQDFRRWLSTNHERTLLPDGHPYQLLQTPEARSVTRSGRETIGDVENRWIEVGEKV